MDLRPCLGKGASLSEEAASAGSGRAGEVDARVGRVRSLAFLSILQEGSPIVGQMWRPSEFSRAEIVVPQPAKQDTLLRTVWSCDGVLSLGTSSILSRRIASQNNYCSMISGRYGQSISRLR